MNLFLPLRFLLLKRNHIDVKSVLKNTEDPIAII